MREHARAALAQFGDRVELRPFELAAPDCRRELPQPLRCVLSPACHPPSARPWQTAAFLRSRAATGARRRAAHRGHRRAGQRSRGTRLRRAVRHAGARAEPGALWQFDGFERFQEQRWNYFAYDYGAGPESGDYPSPLSDQLLWLRAAGFATADAFWLRGDTPSMGDIRNRAERLGTSFARVIPQNRPAAGTRASDAAEIVP